MFGLGEVLRVTGQGIRMQVVVLFADGIERTLLADYGQLQVVSEGRVS
jgi:hypothetical protein